MNGFTKVERPPRPRRYLDPETLQKLGSLELVAREVVEGMRIGMHKSPLRGFSTEFSHHRPYVPGDSLRHLDWRVYARTSRYYLKLYESETDFTAHLLLDASRSMHYRSGAVSKIEYAKFLAASLAHLIVSQRDAVGLGVFDRVLRSYVPPSSLPGIVSTLAEELEKVEPLARTDVAGILHEFAQRVPKRGFVILFSDLLDRTEEFARGLDHLRFRGHNVVVFHILDPAELEFPFDGTLKFKGLEEAEEILTRPRRVREAYLAELGKFIARVRRACERCSVDHVLVDTSRPVDVVLAAYLTWRLRTSV
jgi:uncharacterized protein (DUF58 family)